MEKKWDVIIVGAGPAGLQAAITAAQQGLKVVLVEKQRDISRITRSCCQMLIMDNDYQNEGISVKQGKIVFTRNNFEIDYDGPTVDINEKYYLSPRGHKIHFSHQGRQPIGLRYDKGRLLQQLLQQCERLGVEFINSAITRDAHNSPEGISVRFSRGGKEQKLRAKKLIVADGVNSKLAACLGFNQNRTHFTTALCIMTVMEGVKGFEPHTFKNANGLVYGSKRPILMGPTLLGDNTMDLLVSGDTELKPKEIFHYFTTQSPLAYMFEDAEVVETTGCTLKACSTIPVPYKDSALLIGDAAAFVEVQVQGGIMCGYHAGIAIVRELQGKKGFSEYTRWWNDTFEFNSSDFLRVAQGYSLSPTYNDDELDYLFSLTEDEVLEGTLSQYKTPRLMWESILRHQDRIAREKPEIHEKIKALDSMVLA